MSSQESTVEKYVPATTVIDPCGAEGWHDGNEYRCHLREGHDGNHVDLWEGWEWSPTRVPPPEGTQP